jgi:hypothetical protein
MSAVHPLDDAQLDACVDAALDDTDAAYEAGLFEINNKDRANRTLWKIARLNADLTANEALYKSELDRLTEWIEDERARVAKAKTFLEDLLRGYHRTLHAVDGRLTIRFPAGTLKAAKAKDRVEVDAPRFLADQPDGSPLVRVKREPDKPALLAHVKATGELPTGVTLVEGQVGFSVSPREIDQ